MWEGWFGQEMSGTLCHWPPSAWTMGSWTEWLCWQRWRLSKGQTAWALSRQCPSSYSQWQMYDLATRERSILSSRYRIIPCRNQSYALKRGTFHPDLDWPVFWVSISFSCPQCFSQHHYPRAQEYLVYWCGILYKYHSDHRITLWHRRYGGGHVITGFSHCTTYHTIQEANTMRVW